MEMVITSPKNETSNQQRSPSFREDSVGPSNTDNPPGYGDINTFLRIAFGKYSKLKIIAETVT